MKKTKDRETDKLLSVDVEKLAAMLSCGQATAKKIGEEAGARIVIGRRVLYSVSKVEKYIEKMAG
ncbi:MAG: hypothetical protein HDR09_07475 [Lachnospiraceae bacterium]|nr:hypothetical protein [Lachnospiraceae bacterium]